MATPRSSASPSSRTRRKPISGPALVVLGLVLAGIWFGSQSLGSTKTVTVDNAGSQPVAESAATGSPKNQSAESSPSPSAERSSAAEPVTATQATTSGSLPAGFGSAIPAPANGTVTGSFAGAESDGKKSSVVTYSVPGRAGDVASGYRSTLEKAGFTVDELPGFDFGGEGGAFYGAQKAKLSLTVSISVDQQKTSSAVVTINATGE